MIAPAAGPRPPRLPALRWARAYNPATLRADAVAGITLAAYLLPAAIGDASLAGLPAEAGIYACFFSGIIFWLLCGSLHTTITVTSAISLLLGTSLGSLAAGDADRYRALAACTALLVSAMALGAWLLRGGALVSFVSESVLVGFKTGVALVLASTQLPKLLGISGSHGNFWERSRHLLTHLGETNRGSLLIGLAALGVLILGRLYLRHKPVALLVVIGGIVVSGVLGLEARGVKVLGEVPRGLPVPALPPVAWSDLKTCWSASPSPAGPVSASPSPITHATMRSGLSNAAPNAYDSAYPSSPPSWIEPGVSGATWLGIPPGKENWVNSRFIPSSSCEMSG